MLTGESVISVFKNRNAPEVCLGPIPWNWDLREVKWFAQVDIGSSVSSTASIKKNQQKLRPVAPAQAPDPALAQVVHQPGFYPSDYNSLSRISLQMISLG